jgi:hypothetical protein
VRILISNLFLFYALTYTHTESWICPLKNSARAHIGNTTLKHGCQDEAAGVRSRPSPTVQTISLGVYTSDIVPSPSSFFSTLATPLPFAHTLNGTAAAIPRLIVALLENGAVFDEEGEVEGCETAQGFEAFLGW